MKVQQVVEEVVKSRSIHALDVAVLVAPGEALLADHRVNRVQVRNVGVINKLAILDTKISFKDCVCLNESMVQFFSYLILVVQEVKAINS